MKYLWCLFLLCRILAHSQVSITKVQPPVLYPDMSEKYDSTNNFVGLNPFLLIGQELFCIPKSEENQGYGYSVFYSKYKYTVSISGDIKKYELFAGKTFLVDSVLKHYENFKDNKNALFSSMDECVLKIREKESDQPYYLLYRARYAWRFPFVILGYYEKEKELCKEKKVVLKNRNFNESRKNYDKPIYDIVTGRPVIIDINDIWDIIDLTIEDQYYSLSYIIKNSKNETLAIDLNSIYYSTASDGPSAFIYDSEIEEIKNDNPEMYKSAMESTLRFGMTPKMVKMARGEPENIKSTTFGETYSEEWSYGYHRNSLYFENGKLVRM